MKQEAGFRGRTGSGIFVLAQKIKLQIECIRCHIESIHWRIWRKKNITVSDSTDHMLRHYDDVRLYGKKHVTTSFNLIVAFAKGSLDVCVVLYIIFRRWIYDNPNGCGWKIINAYLRRHYLINLWTDKVSDRPLVNNQILDEYVEL